MPDLPRRDLEGIRVGRSCPGCSPEGPCESCQADLAEAQLSAAQKLGARHRAAGTAPYGDLDDGGDARLLTVLGETGFTTEANVDHRLALVDAYWRALAGE